MLFSTSVMMVQASQQTMREKIAARKQSFATNHPDQAAKIAQAKASIKQTLTSAYPDQAAKISSAREKMSNMSPEDKANYRSQLQTQLSGLLTQEQQDKIAGVKQMRTNGGMTSGNTSVGNEANLASGSTPTTPSTSGDMTGGDYSDDYSGSDNLDNEYTGEDIGEYSDQ